MVGVRSRCTLEFIHAGDRHCLQLFEPVLRQPGFVHGAGLLAPPKPKRVGVIVVLDTRRDVGDTSLDIRHLLGCCVTVGSLPEAPPQVEPGTLPPFVPPEGLAGPPQAPVGAPTPLQQQIAQDQAERAAWFERMGIERDPSAITGLPDDTSPAGIDAFRAERDAELDRMMAERAALVDQQLAANRDPLNGMPDTRLAGSRYDGNDPPNPYVPMVSTPPERPIGTFAAAPYSPMVATPPDRPVGSFPGTPGRPVARTDALSNRFADAFAGPPPQIGQSIPYTGTLSNRFADAFGSQQSLDAPSPFQAPVAGAFDSTPPSSQLYPGFTPSPMLPDLNDAPPPSTAMNFLSPPSRDAFDAAFKPAGGFGDEPTSPFGLGSATTFPPTPDGLAAAPGSSFWKPVEPTQATVPTGGFGMEQPIDLRPSVAGAVPAGDFNVQAQAPAQREGVLERVVSWAADNIFNGNGIGSGIGNALNPFSGATGGGVSGAGGGGLFGGSSSGNNWGGYTPTSAGTSPSGQNYTTGTNSQGRHTTQWQSSNGTTITSVTNPDGTMSTSYNRPTAA